MGLSLPLGHSRVKAARQRIKRADVDTDNQSILRRPLTWGVVKASDGCAVEWSAGESVVWLSLGLSYLLLLHASELFAEEGEIPQSVLHENGGKSRFPRRSSGIWEQSGRGRQSAAEVQRFKRRSEEKGCDISENSGLGTS